MEAIANNMVKSVSSGEVLTLFFCFNSDTWLKKYKLLSPNKKTYFEVQSFELAC